MSMKSYFILFLIAVTSHASNAWAQDAGTIDLSDGTVAVTSAGGNKQPASNGLGLNPGDTIETGADGELHAVLADGGILAVRPNTVVTIAAFSAKGDARDETWINLARGALRTVTGWIGKSNSRAYRITTPTATIGVRGTDFDVVHIPEGGAGPGEIAGTHNRVHEGTTILQTSSGQIEVAPGQAAHVPNVNEMPRLHDRVPAFLENRQGKFDNRIERHARNIDEHMTRSLKERGLLREGETADKHIERSRMQQRQERPGRNVRPERPERHQRPERPDRPERHR